MTSRREDWREQRQPPRPRESERACRQRTTFLGEDGEPEPLHCTLPVDHRPFDVHHDADARPGIRATWRSRTARR